MDSQFQIYDYNFNCSQIELKKNTTSEFMDSNFAQIQQQQQQQQQQSCSLMRYHSAPSSIFSNLIHNSGGSDVFEDYLYRRPSSPEEEIKLEKFISDCNGQSEHIADSHQLMYQAQSQAHQLNSLDDRNLVDGVFGSSLGRSVDVVDSKGFENSMGAKISVGNRSNIVRQSSSPAEFFSNFTVDNGFSMMMGGMGESNPSISKMDKQLNFSSRSLLGSKHMPQISEQNINVDNKHSISNFQNDSLDDSGFNDLKRAKHNDGNMFITTSTALEYQQNTNFGKGMNGLTHHLSLPNNFEFDTYRFMQSQDYVACKTRAKRGFATHPRSIAERVRRKRISERIKRLQELFPNMDKQTSTADMLDWAVDHIKGLQKQLQALADTKAKCSCKRKHKPCSNLPV